jgi:hypothetical protein
MPRPSTATIDSGDEDNNQVESELSDLTDISTEGLSTLVAKKCKGKLAEVAQPMHQSVQVCKPSAHVHRLATGKGMSDGTFQGFPGWHLDYAGQSMAMSTMLLQLLRGLDFGNHAFLADLDGVITAAIRESEGDPKTVSEARSHPDWPSWKEAMDCEIKTLEVART